MSNRCTRSSLGMNKAGIVAAGQERRDDELLDAVVSAAALVARADGEADAVEREQTAYLLARNGRFATVTRADILDQFDHRLSRLQERSGAEAAVDHLRRIAGRAPARLITDTAEYIASADGHLHPREMSALRSIRRALCAATRLRRRGR